MSRTSQEGKMSCSRRRFMASSSAAVAAAAVSRPAAGVTAPKKVRIGVVGGNFGRSFQWHEDPDCIVEAVSDLRRDRRARLMKIYKCEKSYESLEELVKDPKIDAVAIFTDGPLHVKHTLEAMRHGKHVIVAVPCAWASMEQAHELYEGVRQYGLSYMMAETSYYRQEMISARKFYEEGKFGDLFYTESEYQHPGLEALYFEDGKPTWRHGVAPMHYITHNTSYLIGLTGRRLTEVVCHGWGDEDPILKDNKYNNPFWNASALFKDSAGCAFRVNIWWKGAHVETNRAQWIGSKMSFYAPHPNGMGPVLVHTSDKIGRDDAGFRHSASRLEKYDQPKWWKTGMLPEPMRHNTGHGGSHTFLTHEFIDALTHDRKPVIDLYESLAYTVPGIIAHESAMKDGESLKIPSFDL